MSAPHAPWGGTAASVVFHPSDPIFPAAVPTDILAAGGGGEAPELVDPKEAQGWGFGSWVEGNGLVFYLVSPIYIWGFMHMARFFPEGGGFL